jgi:hypothetical protein
MQGNDWFWVAPLATLAVFWFGRWTVGLERWREMQALAGSLSIEMELLRRRIARYLEQVEGTVRGANMAPTGEPPSGPKLRIERDDMQVFLSHTSKLGSLPGAVAFSTVKFYQGLRELLVDADHWHGAANMQLKEVQQLIDRIRSNAGELIGKAENTCMHLGAFSSMGALRWRTDAWLSRIEHRWPNSKPLAGRVRGWFPKLETPRERSERELTAIRRVIGQSEKKLGSE